MYKRIDGNQEFEYYGFGFLGTSGEMNDGWIRLQSSNSNKAVQTVGDQMKHKLVISLT